MLIIAKHQIAAGLKDSRFLFLALIVLTAFLYNSFVYSEKYDAGMQDWRIAQGIADNLLEEQAGNLQQLANVAQELVRPPAALAFVSDSGEERIPNSIEGNAFIVRNLRYLTRGNEMQSSLVAIDWNFIIGALMSLAAVLLSFDAISGEKRDGSLRQLLANPVSRMALFLGKFLGLLVVLLLTLVAGIMINLATGASLGTLPLGPHLLQIIGWVFLLSVFYLAFVLLAGMAVSAMTARPSVTLTLLLVGWVFMVVVIPGAARIAAEQAFETRPAHDVEREIRTTLEAVEDSAPAEARYSTSRGAPNMFPRCELVNARLAAEVRIRNASIAEKLRQARAVHDYASLSPAGILTAAMENLCGTGVTGFNNLIETAHRYRRQLNSFVVERDKLDAESPHIINSWGHYSEAGTFSTQAVEFSSVPRWGAMWREGGFARDQGFPVLRMLLLLGADFLMAVLAFIALARYDPR